MKNPPAMRASIIACWATPNSAGRRGSEDWQSPRFCWGEITKRLTSGADGSSFSKQPGVGPICGRILGIMNEKIRKISAENVIPERTNCFKIGDGVRVHIRLQEGDKERIQVFAGIVIARKGTGSTETFTVRRIASGMGVEKVFPIHSRSIEKIEVEKKSLPMRAKLYYLRGRIGKEAMKVKEQTFTTKAK